MIRFWSIAQNAFMQTIRQPVFMILVLVTFGTMVLVVPLSGYTVSADYHASDQKMLEQVALANLLFWMLWIVALSTTSVLSREIEDRTALTVISKPVSRATFVLGKFAGVTAGVTVAFYLCAIVYLMCVRHGVMSASADPYDMPVLVLGISSLVLAMLIGLAGNYAFGWHMTSTSIWSAVVLLTVSMAVLVFVGKGWTSVPPGYDQPPRITKGVVKIELEQGYSVDALKRKARLEGIEFLTYSPQGEVVTMRYPDHLSLDKVVAVVKTWDGVLTASSDAKPPRLNAQLLTTIVLMYMAVVVLCAVAVAVNTRLGQIATVLIVVLVWALGSIQPSIAKAAQDIPGLRLLAWAVPNMTYFYALDAISLGKKIPLDMVASCALYCLCYVAGVIAVAIALFQTRQVDAGTTSSTASGGVGILAWLGRAESVLMMIVATMLLSLLFVPQQPMAGAVQSSGKVAIAIGGATMLIAGAAGWGVWGAFARGRRWSFYLVLGVTAFCLLVIGAVYLVPSLGKYRYMLAGSGTYMALGTALCVAMLGVLLTPATLRHFEFLKRNKRKDAQSLMGASSL